MIVYFNGQKMRVRLRGKFANFYLNTNITQGNKLITSDGMVFKTADGKTFVVFGG